MAPQNVKASWPHRFTLAFLHEKLLDEGPAVRVRVADVDNEDLVACLPRTVDGLEQIGRKNRVGEQAPSSRVRRLSFDTCRNS
jgi:hypothetical protein